MSLTTRASLIGLFVAQILLFHLIGACFGLEDEIDYNQFRTQAPQPIKCDYNKICVSQAVCVNGVVDVLGTQHIQPRSDDYETCPPGTICCGESTEDDEDEDEAPLPVANGCGFRNEKGVNKNQRNLLKESEFGEFPWMLALLSNNQSEVLYGGASLIHPKIALTVAHVVHDKPNHMIKVRAGEWIINRMTETFPHQERVVLEKIIHEQFNIRNLHYDIALLFLHSPFELSPHINTVCLPTQNLRFDHASCFTTGWGAVQFDGATSNVLKRVSLTVVENGICQGKLRTTYLRGYFRLHDSFMCAGDIEEDACTGDGGSPLVCPIPGKGGRYYEAGIVSWGLYDECGTSGIPGVYCSVSFLRSWVDKKITEKGFDSSSYTAN